MGFQEGYLTAAHLEEEREKRERDSLRSEAEPVGSALCYSRLALSNTPALFADSTCNDSDLTLKQDLAFNASEKVSELQEAQCFGSTHNVGCVCVVCI